MNALLKNSLLAGILCLATEARSASAEPWVLEMDLEWQVVADFDGDGAPDVVIVDRATGQYRVGWQSAPDNVVWTEPRSSGVTGVEGVAAGRLESLTEDSLVFTSADANRVNLLTPDKSKPVFPTAIYPKTVGPNQVVTLDVGGVGNTAHDDLLVATRYNTGGSPGLFERHRNSGTGFSLMNVDIQSEGAFRGSQRAQLRVGDPSVLVILIRDAGAYRLVGADYRNGFPEVAFDGTGPLPDDTLFLAGRFAGLPIANILTYEAGKNTAAVWELSEDTPIEFIPANVFDLTFPSTIGRLTRVADPSGDRLLFIAQDGSQVLVYRFEGKANPELLQTFNASGPGVFTGVLPLGEGHFMTLSGTGGSSSRFDTWLQNGDTYKPGPSGNLPSLDPAVSRATILEFRSEPLVTEGPGLTRSVSVGDWAASAALAGAPLELSATTENFASAVGGLDNPVLTTIGDAHPNTTFALPNQYFPNISFFQLFDARGDEVVEVTVDPAGGSYAQSVSATFTGNPGGADIFYRLGLGDVWKTYSGAPVRIFTNTTLQFYGELGGEKSHVQNEVYEFAAGPDDLDSDGDGVPDYVEIEKGLDPVNSGNDGDGDGFFDRDELLANTDPANPADSPPAGHPRLDDLNIIDLFATPQPYDGSQPVRTTSLPGANVRTFDSGGSLLAAGTTAVLGVGGVPDPTARMTVGVQPGLPWFTLATDSHFDLVTPDADPARGRELLKILPTPENAGLPQVAYLFDPLASMNANATAWIDDLRDGYNARVPVRIAATLREDDTLVALLLESRLAQIFLARGENWATNLTLFPNRPSDAGRRAPTTGELRNLEHRVDPTLPGYRLAALLDHFQAIVKTGVGANLDQLRLLTRDIYRISSELNNDNPGVYVSPIAVFREFIADGSLEPAYAAQTALSPANLAAADTAVQNLLNAAPSRPYQTLQLEIRPDTFLGDCTVLDTVAAFPDTWALFHPGGQSYGALEAFGLLPGAKLQVSGYTDFGSVACGGNGMEVDSISLQFVPAASTFDLDGNLLIDSWEQVFFGGPVNPFDDDDGDLYSNLQEMFEGSDPNDSLGIPGVAVAAMAPPVLNIEILVGGDIRLTWEWPAAYAGQISVQLLSKSELADPFDVTPLVPVYLGSDQFEVLLADPGAVTYFFQFALELDN